MASFIVVISWSRSISFFPIRLDQQKSSMLDYKIPSVQIVGTISLTFKLQFIDTQEKKTSVTEDLRNKEHRITLGFSSLDAPCTHAYS